MVNGDALMAYGVWITIAPGSGVEEVVCGKE